MTKQRIMAHFMHEAEEAAALAQMTNVERTESYVRGELQQMKSTGAKLDLAMLSHVDNDHVVGGARPSDQAAPAARQ